MNESVKPEKRKWYSGQYIVDELRREDFELFDLMNAGVQVITQSKKKVVDRDPLLKKKYTLEYLEEDEWTCELLARGKDQTGKVIVKGQGHYTEKKKLEKIETNKIARRKWEKLPKIFFDDPVGCESISFSLNNNIDPSWFAFSRAKDFRYLAADVDKFFNNEDNLQNETADPRKRPEQKDKEKAFEEIENYFHHEGAVWRIGFQGEKGNFLDFKYIRYISLLLETPGKAIGALELVHAVDSYIIPERKSKKQALDEGLTIGNNYRDEEISIKKVREFEKLLSDHRT